MEIVRTRKDHACMCGCSISSDGARVIPKGSLALRETAIIEDMGWRSTYFSIECLDKWYEEWEAPYD